MNFTPDQTNSLKTWAEERDRLLGELSHLKDEKNRLISENKILGQEQSSLVLAIEKNKTSLELHKTRDEERSILVSKDIASLEAKKTELETTVSFLDKQLSDKKERLTEVETSLSNLTTMYERVSWQIGQLKEALMLTVRSNQESTKDVNIMISELRKFLSEVEKDN